MAWLSLLHGLIQPQTIAFILAVGAAITLFLYGQARLAIGVLVVGLLVSACLMFQGLQSALEQTRASLAHTRQMLATAQANARMHQSATNEADHTERVDRESHAAVQVAQQEIDNAVDAHGLYVAWVDGIGRVRNDPGAATA